MERVKKRAIKKNGLRAEENHLRGRLLEVSLCNLSERNPRSDLVMCVSTCEERKFGMLRGTEKFVRERHTARQ